MIVRLLEVEVLVPGGIALTKSATWLLPMRRRLKESCRAIYSSG